MKDEKLSQAGKIRRKLEEHRGDWISMPTLADVGRCYAVHSRIADIRRDGVEVENKIVQGPDGAKLSYYRIPSPAGTLELF